MVSAKFLEGFKKRASVKKRFSKILDRLKRGLDVSIKGHSSKGLKHTRIGRDYTKLV